MIYARREERHVSLFTAQRWFLKEWARVLMVFHGKRGKQIGGTCLKGCIARIESLLMLSLL